MCRGLLPLLLASVSSHPRWETRKTTKCAFIVRREGHFSHGWISCGRIWNLMQPFFPSSGTLIQKTLREERLCLPVVSMLILVPFSVYSQFEMWNLPVFTSHSYIVLKPNLIKCWFLPAKFIDLSVCTGHLMLGFFEPTYRHRMAQGRCWRGQTKWNADLCVSASAASIHICIMSSMSNMTMESKT